jgi:hypothetical protein
MLHRRDAMLRLGQAGLGALALPSLLQRESAAAPSRRARAKSCILIYLWGGPPQQDMWDMKPLAPEGIRSQFAPIETNVPGIQFCDQLPLMARQADKMCVVRSYTHPSNAHEVGVYHTLTGKHVPTMVIPRNQRSRSDFPSPGSIVAHFSPLGTMPATVTIPKPIGHDGIVYSGTHAGFLGARFDPFEQKSPGEVQAQAPHQLELPAGLDATRMQARFGLLNLLEGFDRQAQSQPPAAATGGLGEFRDQAYRMLVAPEARAAFDLDREPAQLRDRYGRNEYGESFLLARRLIESGVRLTTIVWSYICPDGNVANVWDNHGGTGSLGSITGFQMLKEA